MSSRHFLMFSVLCVSVSCVFGYNWSDNPGDGSEANPYQISTPEQLVAIKNLDTTGVYFVMTNDIDLDPNLPGNQVFSSAIISSDVAFEGVFGGNEHVIRNMQIIDETEGISFLGLFGKIGPDGIVKNLTISDYDIRVQVRGHFGFAGSLAGQNLGIIINCFSSGSAGPIAEGKPFDCMIGGLVGINGDYDFYHLTYYDHRGLIASSGSHSNLTILYGGAGLVSYNLGNIYQCYSQSHISDGELHSLDSNGGLVSRNFGVVDQCFSDSVMETDSNSGLCGWNGGIVRNCYALGVMKKADFDFSESAGLVVANIDFDGNMLAKIENCYAACKLEDPEYAFGLAGGWDEFYGSATSSYWDTEVSSTIFSYFGDGLTTAQMKQKASYVDWDFENIWFIDEGNDYPILRWQISNTIPVANSGRDKTTFAWIDGYADVQLYGTGSFDEDGDVLEYFWYNDANELIATGAKPNVLLPIGEHVIELIVNDGIDDSEPNSCVVTVIEAMETTAKIMPQMLNRKSTQPCVMGRIEFIGEDMPELDPNQPMLLVAGQVSIESQRQMLVYSDEETAWYLAGFFDRALLMEAIDNNPLPASGYSPLAEGELTMMLATKLINGQWVYGRDIVTVK